MMIASSIFSWFGIDLDIFMFLCVGGAFKVVLAAGVLVASSVLCASSIMMVFSSCIVVEFWAPFHEGFLEADLLQEASKIRVL